MGPKRSNGPLSLPPFGPTASCTAFLLAFGRCRVGPLASRFPRSHVACRITLSRGASPSSSARQPSISYRASLGVRAHWPGAPSTRSDSVHHPCQPTPQSGRRHRNRTSGGHGTEPGLWGDKYRPTSPLSSHPFSATHKHRGAAAGNHRRRTSVPEPLPFGPRFGGGKH